MSCATCSTSVSGFAKKCPAFFCASRIISGIDEANEDGDHSVRGPHQAPRLWVLTVDKHHIHIFEKQGQKLVRIVELSDSGRIAFTADTADLIRHVEKNVADHHGSHQDIQLKKLSSWLDETLRNDAFDRLVLIAPPRLLGDIRKVLSHGVQARIIAEINKDLTSFHANELKEELQKIMWF